MYSYILFDLDGTVINSFEGITKSVEFALNRFGINVEDRKSLVNFIGPPLDYSFMEYYGFSEEQAKKAIEYYRERYHIKGWKECELMPGIADTMKALCESGKKLAIATSKPEVFSKKITEYLKLDGYLSVNAGAELDGSRIHKADVIRYAMKKLGNPNPSQVLMVGDRKHDVEGAKQAGIRCAGYLGGFGTYEELKQAGADYIIDSFKELMTIDS